MYVITSNTSNEIAVDVMTDGKLCTVHLKKKYSTTASDELTNNMTDLNAIGIIKYAEVPNIKEEIPVQNSNNNSSGRGRGRRSNSNPSTNSTEDNNDKEDVKDESKVEETKDDKSGDKEEKGGK